MLLPLAANSQTFILNEGFEGDNTAQWHFYYSVALTGINMDDSTNVIEGSQSLAASSFWSQGNVYVLNSPAYYWDQNSTTDWYAFFLYKCVQAPQVGHDREICWAADTSYHLGTLYIYSQSDGLHLTCHPYAGTPATTAAAFQQGTTNAIWIRVQAGTGSNARMDVWWAPYFNPGDAVKPADGSNWHAHSDDGQQTVGVAWIQLGAVYRNGDGIDGIFDHVLAATNAIGDNPAMTLANTPPSVALNASPGTVQPGGQSTLTWTTSNATNVTITGFGQVALSGSVTVTPTATTTYTATAYGSGGITTASATVSVTGTSPSAPSVTLTASPTSISSGQTTMLAWTSANATNVTVSGFGSVSLNGNLNAWPGSTTTYTATAYGSGGIATASVTVSVTGTSSPAPSVTLTASPTSISSGQTTMLAWTSANATNVTVSGFGSVSLNGNLNAWPGSTTTYTATAYGSGGITTASATVTVTGASPSAFAVTLTTPRTIISSRQTPMQSGYYTFTVLGESGRACDIEASSDLQNWSKLETVILLDGSAFVRVPLTPSNQFYRAKLLP